MLPPVFLHFVARASRHSARGLIVLGLVNGAGAVAQGQAAPPPVITLPGANDFDLKPATPTPTPSARPTPRAIPTPRVTPSPRPTGTPGPRPTATARVPVPLPIVRSSPAAAPSASSTPVPLTTDRIEPVPSPIITASPLALPKPSAAQAKPRPPGDAILNSLGMPAMTEQLSLALFVGGAAVLALIVILLFGRRKRPKRHRVQRDDAERATPAAPQPRPAPQPVPVPPEPVPAPPPPVMAAPQPPVAPPPPAERAPLPLPPVPAARADVPSEPARITSPRRAAPSAAPDQPGLKLEFQPLRAGTEGNRAVVELILTIRNIGSENAAHIRIRPGVISASPDQGPQMEAFHAATALGGSAFQPFSLARGDEQQVPMRLTMPQDAIHVVTVSDRPMFMPIVMIDVGWRGGLSLKRMGADFMVGIEATAGAPGDGRLGPFWLDRGERIFDNVTARIIRRA